LLKGRVDDLWVASDHERWGTYDAVNDRVREHDLRWDCDDDLLNLAIIHGFATRAHVHVVAQKDVPGSQACAAIYRY
jgi:hypothetical protein